MSKSNKISLSVLRIMNDFLDNQKNIGQPAQLPDMKFIAEGTWLKDAAVIDLVQRRNGAWDVSLVFAHHREPLKFLIRNITRCYTIQKAAAAAFYIRKEAAKDTRGTLQVSLTDVKLCWN